MRIDKLIKISAPSGIVAAASYICAIYKCEYK